MEEIDNEEDLELELLQDELEYLQLMSHFFENQTKIWGELVNKVELRQKESLEEEQALIDKLNEGQIEKVNLISHLNALKKQVDTKASKGTKNIIGKNGFFECTECPKKSKRKYNVICHIKTIHRIDHKFLDCPECHFKSNNTFHMKKHINEVHPKLRLYKCSDCDKGWSDKTCAFQFYLKQFFNLFQRLQ